MRLSARLFCTCLLFLAFGCGQTESPRETPSVDKNQNLSHESRSEVDIQIQSVNASEELLQSLAQEMSRVPKWLSAPNSVSPIPFADKVSYSGIDRFDFRAALKIEEVQFGGGEK